MADDAPVDARTMTDAEFDAAMKARSWRVPQEPSGPVRLTREDVLALSEADLRLAERRRDWRRRAAATDRRVREERALAEADARL